MSKQTRDEAVRIVTNVALDRDFHAALNLLLNVAMSNPAALVRANNPNFGRKHFPSVDSLIKAGDRIGAIKEHRSITGVGLRESKDYVEARLVQLGF